MIKNLVRVLVVAALLGLWDVFIKNLYIGFLEANGRFYGWGESFLGYMIVLLIGYILSFFITKHLGGTVET